MKRWLLLLFALFVCTVAEDNAEVADNTTVSDNNTVSCFLDEVGEKVYKGKIETKNVTKLVRLSFFFEKPFFEVQ